MRWECLGPHARQIWHQYNGVFGFCSDGGGHKWIDDIHFYLRADNWSVLVDGAATLATFWGSHEDVWVFDSSVPHIYTGDSLIFTRRPLDWAFLKQAEAATIGAGASMDTGLTDDDGDSGPGRPR